MADTVRMRLLFYMMGIIGVVSIGTSAHTIREVSALTSMLKDEIHSLDKRVIAIESSRVKPTDLEMTRKEFDLKIEGMRHSLQLQSIALAQLEAKTQRKYE